MYNTIHFGAGNIGRGFIAPVLKLDNNINEIKFLDINQEIISNLNNQKKYTVFEMGNNINEILVDHISGNLTDEILDSNLNQYINQTNLITISIGQNNLKHITKYISHIIKNRESKEPLVIVCCENGNRVSTYLKSLLVNESWSNNVFFVDAVVDRIIPLQHSNEIDVKVEQYYSWIVDNKQWPKNMIKISSIKYSNDLDAEINKKICLLNGVHAAIAWHRYSIDKFKISTLQEAIVKPETQTFVKSLMEELVDIISEQYNFKRTYLMDYTKQLLVRFENPHLIDDLERIGRNPITKIQINERILSPLFYAQENNLDYSNLLSTFKNALNYHYENDAEGLELKNFSKENNKASTIKHFIKNISQEQINILLK